MQQDFFPVWHLLQCTVPMWNHMQEHKEENTNTPRKSQTSVSMLKIPSTVSHTSLGYTKIWQSQPLKMECGCPSDRGNKNGHVLVYERQVYILQVHKKIKCRRRKCITDTNKCKHIYYVPNNKRLDSRQFNLFEHHPRFQWTWKAYTPQTQLWFQY